jgi:hypothetical protein
MCEPLEETGLLPMSSTDARSVATSDAVLIASRGSSDEFSNNDNEYDHESQISVNNVRLRLYISHFLSTWNSRVFEFGAVLYLAAIFPTTLLPMSVYALVRGTSAIVFSSNVGSYIDKSERLSAVRLSIGKSGRIIASDHELC